MTFCSLVVKHLGNFHGEVQALCGLPADVTDGAAVGAHTPAQVTAVARLHERLQQAAGLAAARRGAQRADPAVAPSDRGQQTVQRSAEEAGQQNRSAKFSERKGETAVQG